MNKIDYVNSPDRCTDCGAILRVGDFPFCSGRNAHGRGTAPIVPDDVPGGFVVENGFDVPTKFYSHTEHERALAARGLEIRAKYAGDNDRIMSNWAAGVDAQTLTNAAELVSRGTQARREQQQRWAQASMTITVTDGGTFTGKDLRRADEA